MVFPIGVRLLPVAGFCLPWFGLDVVFPGGGGVGGRGVAISNADEGAIVYSVESVSLRSDVCLGTKSPNVTVVFRTGAPFGRVIGLLSADKGGPVVVGGAFLMGVSPSSSVVDGGPCLSPRTSIGSPL